MKPCSRSGWMARSSGVSLNSATYRLSASRDRDSCDANVSATPRSCGCLHAHGLSDAKLTDGVNMAPGSITWSAAGPGDCDLCGGYTGDRSLFVGRLRRWGLCVVCVYQVIDAHTETVERVHEIGEGSGF